MQDELFAEALSTLPFFPSQSKSRCCPFCQIRQGCLRAEPAAPDPPQQHGDQKKSKGQSQAEQKYQVEFFDPECLSEKVQGQFWNVYAEETFAVNLQPGYQQYKQSYSPLAEASPRREQGKWFLRTGFS